jgi:acyl-CoA thioesterase
MSTSSWPFLPDLPEGRESEIQKRVAALPFAKLLGMEVVAIEADRARLALGFRPDLTQPAGLLHGGVFATLIDTAAAQAIASTIAPGFSFVTIQLDTKYFAPLQGGRIEASARIVRKGKRIVHIDTQVHDGAGTLLAQGWCCYTILPPA